MDAAADPLGHGHNKLADIPIGGGLGAEEELQGLTVIRPVSGRLNQGPGERNDRLSKQRFKIPALAVFIEHHDGDLREILGAQAVKVHIHLEDAVKIIPTVGRQDQLDKLGDLAIKFHSFFDLVKILQLRARAFLLKQRIAGS